MPTNQERMAALAEEFFHTQDDPDQLVVTGEVIERLQAIHPRTLNQEATVDGPICWILLVPTTAALMEQFLAGRIGERELLNRTEPGGCYEAIYLCSALVLPEHRGGGVARRVCVEAIRAIGAEHPIRRLFYWSFSPEGERLAASVARASGLPLSCRAHAPTP